MYLKSKDGLIFIGYSNKECFLKPEIYFLLCVAIVTFMAVWTSKYIADEQERRLKYSLKVFSNQMILEFRKIQ